MAQNKGKQYYQKSAFWSEKKIYMKLQNILQAYNESGILYPIKCKLRRHLEPCICLCTWIMLQDKVSGDICRI